MKRNLLIMALYMLVAVGAQAQSDTLKVLNPDSVIVITNGNEVTVDIQGKKHDDIYRYKKNFMIQSDEPVVSRESHSRDFDLALPLVSNKKSTLELTVVPTWALGYNFVQNKPGDFDFDNSESNEFWLPNVLKISLLPRNKHLNFSLAYGLDWRNYRMTGVKRFNKDEAGVVVHDVYPDGTIPQFSRIKTFSHTFTLLAGFKPVKGVWFRLGPVVSLNTHSSLLTRYKDSTGKKVKESQSGPKLNVVTVDLLASLSWTELGIYLKYSPMNVIRSGWGPQYSNVSVGATFFW